MEQIDSEEFPALSIPLSMGTRSGGFVFISGQGPLDLDTAEIVGDTIREQTEITLNHVDSVLKAADLGSEDVVNVTVYITDSEYYDGFNEAYAAYFSEPYPSRSCIVTDLLHENQLIEIEAIAET